MLGEEGEGEWWMREVKRMRQETGEGRDERDERARREERKGRENQCWDAGFAHARQMRPQ